MLVRLATPEDAEATRSIWNAEVLGSTFVFEMVPRSPPEQELWLAGHAGAHPLVVAEDGPELGVCGYACLSAFHSRPAYATTVEDSVYVRADQRGRGIGRLLLTDILGRARAHGFHAVIARIADHNQASISLHQACGFELVGVEREVGRKFGRWLDVVVMQRML